MPAACSTMMLGSISLMTLMESRTYAMGLEPLPPPMISEGSGLMMSGCSWAMAFASSSVSAQAKTRKSSSRARSMVFFICGRLMGFSQWLIITPTAPAAFKPSGRISAQPRPGRSVSIYVASTNRCFVFSATRRTSSAGQMNSTSMSYFSAAASAALAYSRSLSPYT